MPINESSVEDAALTWFGELGYAVGHGAVSAVCNASVSSEPTSRS